MSHSVLIVDSDPGMSAEMQAILEGKGFAVEVTGEGKKSIDLIRRSLPDLVVLSVELAAGQSGYILCGKLKKDDELKSLPVVIVGNPDGFAQHSKLRTRADAYVSKPVDPEVLVDRVGGLIGLPEAPEEPAEDSLTMDDLVAEASGEELPAEEISLDEVTFQGDPELEMVDAAFDGQATLDEATGEEPVEASLETVADEFTGSAEPFADRGSVSQEADRAFEAMGTSEELGTDASASGSSPSPAPAGGEPRSLRPQLVAWQRSLSEAQARQNEAEDRVRDLEAQLESRSAELEAVAARGGKGDKEFFALREALNKKEKAILLLTTELKDKEAEVVDLRDHEVQLEQQVSEVSMELARRDAQIKALTARIDPLGVDRKRIQEELNNTRNKLQVSQSTAEDLEARVNELDSSLRKSTDEGAQLRSRLEELQSSLEVAQSSAQNMQARLAEETEALRARVQELEQVRERVKKELSMALHFLESPSSEDEDESAAA